MKRGRPVGQSVIKSVEITLTSGLHIVVAPTAGRAWCWVETGNGYRMDYEESTIEQLLTMLRKLQAERRDASQTALTPDSAVKKPDDVA